ncbi:MAG: DNA polymerase III subunit delta, partial [Balneolales bacterium]|nr:DNA polymerase III subunit delta [Balneolales bacterium]
MARKQNSADRFQEVLQHFNSGSLKPVYFLYGEEEFYLDQLLDKFLNVLPPHEKDFNLDLLYGQEVTPANVLGIARSFPMMAERRVVIVRNFLQMAKGASGEGDMNDFITYFEQPNPSCLL